jgi:DNA-binding transcriptional ArsR family regulator
MFENAEIASVAKILAALGNTTRLALVTRLSMAETFAGQSISELTETSGLTRQAITKHLEALADAGLVRRRKPGRATWYELEAEAVDRAIKTLTVISKQRARSRQKLKSYKEEILGKDS